MNNPNFYVNPSFDNNLKDMTQDEFNDIISKYRYGQFVPIAYNTELSKYLHKNMIKCVCLCGTIVDYPEEAFTDPNYIINCKDCRWYVEIGNTYGDMKVLKIIDQTEEKQSDFYECECINCGKKYILSRKNVRGRDIKCNCKNDPLEYYGMKFNSIEELNEFKRQNNIDQPHVGSFDPCANFKRAFTFVPVVSDNNKN